MYWNLEDKKITFQKRSENNDISKATTVQSKLDEKSISFEFAPLILPTVYVGD